MWFCLSEMTAALKLKAIFSGKYMAANNFMRLLTVGA